MFPATSHDLNPLFSRQLERRRWPFSTDDRRMIQSHPIEVDGVFVGAAVRLDRGYRFIALNLRLDDLDGVIRPELQDIRTLAHRAYNTRRGAIACGTPS